MVKSILSKQNNKHFMYKYLLPYKGVYSFYLTLIVLSVPLQLAVILLLSHAITLLQTRAHHLTWVEIVGEHAARWLKPFVRNTPWQTGMDIVDQYSFFPLGLIFLSTTLFATKVVSEWCIEWISEKVALDLRNNLVKDYLSLTFADALKVDKGSLGTRIAEDTREARLVVTRLWGSVPANILSSVFFITWLVLLDTQLFFLFVSILTPSIFIIRWATKLLKGLSREGLQSQGSLHDSLLEKLTHWQTIRTFRGFEIEFGRFSKDNEYLYKIWRRATRAKSLSTPLVEWLATMAGCCVIVVALKRISEDALSQSAFTSFLVTVGYLAAHLQEVSTQLTHSRKGKESWRRLFQFSLFAKDVHSLPPSLERQSPGNSLEPLQVTAIRVENVQLGTLETGPQAVQNLFPGPLDITLNRGDFLAIYGPSGIGKTTFLTALLGLIPTNEGRIYWEACGKELSFEDLTHLQVHYISQDPFLIIGTLLENILYPLTCEDMNAQAGDFTMVTEKAQRSLAMAQLEGAPLDSSVLGLSGGEKQRLAFARAFFHRTPVLVIDEGTSALDPVSEEVILGHLKDYAKNAIVVMVTHRPSVLNFSTRSLEFLRRA